MVSDGRATIFIRQFCRFVASPSRIGGMAVHQLRYALCSPRGEEKNRCPWNFSRKMSKARKRGRARAAFASSAREEMSFPTEKKSPTSSVTSEKGEVRHEEADSAANSISSRQKLAKESGIKPIFLAKVNRINEAISECGMGRYGQSDRNATIRRLTVYLLFLATNGSSSSPDRSDTLPTTSGCTLPFLPLPDSIRHFESEITDMMHFFPSGKPSLLLCRRWPTRRGGGVIQRSGSLRWRSTSVSFSVRAKSISQHAMLRVSPP